MIGILRPILCRLWNRTFRVFSFSSNVSGIFLSRRTGRLTGFRWCISFCNYIWPKYFDCLCCSSYCHKCIVSGTYRGIPVFIKLNTNSSPTSCVGIIHHSFEIIYQVVPFSGHSFNTRIKSKHLWKLGGHSLQFWLLLASSQSDSFLQLNQWLWEALILRDNIFR